MDNKVKGWFLSGSDPFNYEMGIDRQVVRQGKASGYLKSKTVLDSTNFATMMQQFKLVGRPLKTAKEVLQTLGYSAIGVVVYMFIIRMIFGLINSFTTIDWDTREVVFIGLWTLVLIAVLSPLGTLYTFIKSKMLQSLYLLGSSLLFIWLMNSVTNDLYVNLEIPFYMYLSFGLFYFICSIVNTNSILMEKK